MKKEFWDLILEVAPVIFIVSVASSFLKGVKSVVEYFMENALSDLKTAKALTGSSLLQWRKFSASGT